MLERQQREHGLDRAGCRNRMPDHRLVRRHRNLRQMFAEHDGGGVVFHLVVFRRRGAVRVDMVDLLRLEAGIGQRLAHAADDRLAVRARAGAVERVGQLAAAGQHAEDLRATGNRGLIALEHQRAGAFGHDETVAVFRERF